MAWTIGCWEYGGAIHNQSAGTSSTQSVGATEAKATQSSRSLSVASTESASAVAQKSLNHAVQVGVTVSQSISESYIQGKAGSTGWTIGCWQGNFASTSWLVPIRRKTNQTASVIALYVPVLTLVAPYQLDTQYFQDGQGVNSISEGDVRTAVAGLAGTPTTQQTGTTYQTVISDAGTCVDFTSSSAITITVPLNATVPYMVGTTIEFFQAGTGQITLVGAGGVTLLSPLGSLATRAQYCSIAIRLRAADQWIVSGDLA